MDEADHLAEKARNERRTSILGLRQTCLALSAFALMLCSCGTGRTAQAPSSPSPTPTASSPDSSIEQWVSVKYRPSAVNVGQPKYENLGRTDSSVVLDAWYSATDQYMVINLNGTNYHYCAFPSSAWRSLRTASSMGAHYHDSIRGNYDCRYVGSIPDQ